MTELHSKLPPSSAARRMACPGSRALTERYGRNEKSEASIEGDLAHELAAIYLRLPDCYEVDKTIPKFTDEMHEGALFYREAINLFLNLSEVNIEQYVDISNIHPDMWGTPDAWGISDAKIDRDREALHIFDYKFGFTPVDAFENWQLIAYACGAFEFYTDRKFEIDEVYFHIIQPRDYLSPSKHQVWKISTVQLETYRQRLQISEALAMSPNASLRVSSECRYCPARHACPALKQAAFGATEMAFRDAPQGLTHKEVGTELKLLHEARDLLEYRITALETEATHYLTSGLSVDNYELTARTGALSWNVDKKEILGLGQVLGFDLRKEEVLTPTQALKAGLSEEIVLKYAERKQSLKLSKIDLTKSKEVFKK